MLCLGNTAARAGADRNWLARSFESLIIVPIASRIGANRDLAVAACKFSGTVNSESSSTKQHPVATTKEDSRAANASNVPAWASLFLCPSSRHVLVISAAENEICCWTAREGEDCDRTCVRFARCCSVYSSLYRLSSPWSGGESSKESPSAMAFRVFKVARTALGGNSAGDNMVKRGEMTRPAVNGETYAGPPVCLHYSIRARNFPNVWTYSVNFTHHTQDSLGW